MQIAAIYPGTFDPITYGHVDLVQRAANLFDRVIVAVAASAKKTPLFSLAERMQLATEIFAPTKNVEICSFDGLLVDLAQQQNAQVVVRGIRSGADIEFEFQLASMNKAMNQKLETVFMMPAEQYAFISSSIVREIASMKGDLTPFVPPVVISAFALREKLWH